MACPPAPALRAVVVEYRAFQDEAPGSDAQVEPASTRVPLILDLGAGWLVAAPATGHREQWLRGFGAGMHETYALVRAAGPARGVQVDLSPAGARRLFGVPMHELRNRVVPLPELLGPEAGLLIERLAEARSSQEQFAVLDRALERPLRGSAAGSPEVEWAWAELERTAGSVPIGRLRAELGWSRKRLAARFREEIGLTPKAVARVMRFEALLRRLWLRSVRAPRWAELALECGYFDQSHLVREVRALAGRAPHELLAGLRVQPGPPVATVARETSVQDGRDLAP